MSSPEQHYGNDRQQRESTYHGDQRKSAAPETKENRTDGKHQQRKQEWRNGRPE